MVESIGKDKDHKVEKKLSFTFTGMINKQAESEYAEK